MMHMRRACNTLLVTAAAIATISCSATSDQVNYKGKTDEECPILYQFKSGRLLDLRKPGWDAVKDAKENIRLGQRRLIGTPSELEGIAFLADEKYSDIKREILSDERDSKYEKYDIELTGMGTLASVNYWFKHGNFDKCKNQDDQLKLYAPLYNNYILEDILNDLKKSERREKK